MKNNQIYDDFKKTIKQKPHRYIEDYYRIKEIVDNSSAIYEGEPVDFLYQPVFYTKEEINDLKKLCQQLINILKKVISKYKEEAQFRKFFPFSSLIEELILVDPGYNQEFPITRFDIFYGAEQVKFCELNSDGTSGMNEVRVIQDCLKKSNIVQDLEEKYNFKGFELFYSWIDKVKENYKQFSDNPLENPSLAIVDFEGDGVESEFKEFKKRFNEKGIQAFICDPVDLEYKNGALYYQDQIINIIYRRATTARLLENPDEVSDLLDAYRDQNVCMIGGVVSQLIHNKIIFAVLHQLKDHKFMNSSEKQFITDHIPYTAIFEYDDQEIYQKVLENKNQYILKPWDWYACHGVYAGADYSREQWQEILEDIKEKNYIFQEFCSPPARKFLSIKDRKYFFEEYNVLTGVYLYNGEFKGIYNRVGRKNIIGDLVESFTLPAFVTKRRRN